MLCHHTDSDVSVKHIWQSANATANNTLMTSWRHGAETLTLMNDVVLSWGHKKIKGCNMQEMYNLHRIRDTTDATASERDLHHTPEKGKKKHSTCRGLKNVQDVTVPQLQRWCEPASCHWAVCLGMSLWRGVKAMSITSITFIKPTDEATAVCAALLGHVYYFVLMENYDSSDWLKCQRREGLKHAMLRRVFS